MHYSAFARTTSKLALLGVSTCLISGLATTARAQETYSTLIFTGVDVTEDSWAIYKGGLYWLNRDWTRDGFVLRGLGVVGNYDYFGGPAGFTPIDGDYHLLEGMIGYQIFRNYHRFALLAGVESQDHDLSPNDPSNSVSGRETGFKIAGEMTLNFAPRWQANLKGSYSTAFESYWSKIDVGYKITDHMKAGPEAFFTGNQESESQRVGAFVELTDKFLETPVYLTFSAGYQFGDDSSTTPNSSSGPYATGALAFAF